MNNEPAATSAPMGCVICGRENPPVVIKLEASIEGVEGLIHYVAACEGHCTSSVLTSIQLFGIAHRRSDKGLITTRSEVAVPDAGPPSEADGPMPLERHISNILLRLHAIETLPGMQEALASADLADRARP